MGPERYDRAMDDDRQHMANTLRVMAQVARARNGRLAIDWISRRQRPRWRMLRLNGDWYDRQRLGETVRRRGPVVPASRRPLTPAELEELEDPNPWGLFPPRRRVRP